MEEKIILEEGYAEFHQWFNTIRADENTFKERPLIYSEFIRMTKKADIGNPMLCVSDYIGGPQAAIFPDNKIVISRKMLEILTDQEVVAVLGHEIGHAKNFAKHGFLNKHAAKIGAASGVVAGGIASAAVLYYVSGRGADEEKRPLTRRTFLARAGGVTATLATCGLIGNKQGYSYGQESPEFEADEVAISLGIPKEDLVSAFKKIIEWHEKEGHASGPIMRNRLKHWDR